jgi:hypothetical protein
MKVIIHYTHLEHNFNLIAAKIPGRRISTVISNIMRDPKFANGSRKRKTFFRLLKGTLHKNYGLIVSRHFIILLETVIKRIIWAGKARNELAHSRWCHDKNDDAAMYTANEFPFVLSTARMSDSLIAPTQIDFVQACFQFVEHEHRASSHDLSASIFQPQNRWNRDRFEAILFHMRETNIIIAQLGLYIQQGGSPDGDELIKLLTIYSTAAKEVIGDLYTMYCGEFGYPSEIDI